ncbi:unnamed protein product [Heterobilharzia americana]|nr:unnamed protein product [Heterobilharzia americana]
MITTNESDNDTDDSDDIVDDLLHGNSLQEINYFHDSPQYVNKTVCKSQYTWREITIPWRVLMKNFNSNCTHLLGNLIISGLDQDDDITFLENIEEISGYLVIYGVGRKELRLPRLKLIKGLDYVSFKSRKVSLLVVSNYMKSTEQNEVFNEFSSPSDMLSSTTTTATHSDDTLKAKNSGLRHLQSLEMTSLISIVQHGIYFYDNPGLCYTPFTLKWDEMIESSELQTIDLLAIHSDANIFLWYEYCQCKYLNLCTNTRNNNDKTTTKSSLFNVSIQVEQLTNELSQQIDNDLKKRSNIKKKRDVMNIIEQVKDGVSGSLQDTLNLSISSTELQRNHSVSQMTPLKDDIILSEDEEKRIASIDHSENEDSYTTTLLADDNMKEITQLTNMFEGNKLVAKIGRELDDLYDESSNSISEQFHDETTETTLEISSEDHSINNEASTTTNLDETVSTVETTGNESIEYNTLLINQTSTLQYPDHENTTDSSIMTTASNEPMTTDNSSPNTYNPKNEKESAIAYPTERPNLPCHPVCPAIQGKRYCWGPGPDQCQAVHKCQVRLCEGSNWCFRKRSYTFEKDISIHHSRQLHTSVNYGYSKEHCCHSECAAGCHGPRARDCNACLRLSNRGVCTDSCPASRIYNKSTFSWRENPDGLLTFGSICVKSCPKTYLRDGDHCVSKCARPGYFAYRGQCIPCPNSICPKVCTLKEIESIKGVDYLHRRSLRAMENCTIFEGDIKLSMQSFIGDPFYNLSQIDEGVQWEDLVIGLSKLEQITGILYISAGFHAPWMTNLTFLSNVKIIGGISPNIQQTRTININLNHHLEFLGMTSLRRLGHPSVLITGNPRLCYVDTIDWTTLFTDELITHSNENKQILLPKMSKIDFIENGLLSQTTTLLSSTERRVLRRRRPIKESAVFIGGNAHFEFCRGRGAMCDEVCQPHAGCWGPGIKFCYYCKYWSVESPKGGQLCVQKCEDVPGFYTPIINNSEIDSKEMLTTGLNKLTILQYNTTNNLTTNETTNPLEISSTYPTAGNSQPKEIQVLSHTFPPMQCQKCSSMCSLQKNTCNGPNEDQCIGSCRFVKDGPFCRANCPPNKYADPLTKSV